MKVLLVLVVAAAFAAPASASSGVNITIRHQKVGCHSWAIANGAYKPTQSLTVKTGTSLTFGRVEWSDYDDASATTLQGNLNMRMVPPSGPRG